MRYYAAFLRMQDPAKAQVLRPQHIEFLERGGKEGKVHARGRFADGTGGLVIYRAESLEEARKLAESDPYVSSGARALELHEWDVKFPG